MSAQARARLRPHDYVADSDGGAVNLLISVPCECSSTTVVEPQELSPIDHGRTAVVSESGDISRWPSRGSEHERVRSMTRRAPGAPNLRRAELHISPAAEQIVAMPALRKHHWTAADVRALMDNTRHWPRYELLDGELIVTNAPTTAHQIAVSELLTRLSEYCKREDIGIALTSPADIELAPESIMQPDVFVVANDVIPSDEPFRWPHVRSLLLAVEVLSPSSLRTDRVDG